MRGNHANLDLSDATERSIPACAGEPSATPARTTNARVYPRVCGGTGWEVLPPLLTQGLSPRVRGNRGRTMRSFLAVGSIPACAGEPERRASDRLWWGVYPRVCGGTVRSLRNRLVVQGLSPRVRGNPGHCGHQDCLRGSIPACAGEPGQSRRMAPIHKVYPRVCGGTAGEHWLHDIHTGLSPRVRGNPPVADATTV